MSLYDVVRSECMATDTEVKTLLNEVVIFVFFAHKKYSRSLFV